MYLYLLINFIYLYQGRSMITFYKLLFLSYKVYDMSYIFDVKYKMNIYIINTIGVYQRYNYIKYVIIFIISFFLIK